LSENRERLVHDKIATLDERRFFGRIAARVSLPYENLFERYAILLRFVEGNIRFLFVIEKLAAPVIGIHRNQHAAF
jgi:hypothetical protein